MNKPTSAIADMHVIVDLAGTRSATGVAAALARQLGAHVSGLVLAFEPLIPGYTTAFAVPNDVVLAARQTALHEANAAAMTFETIAKRLALPFDTRVLVTIAGEGFADVVEVCRLSDLVVVGQNHPDAP